MRRILKSGLLAGLLLAMSMMTLPTAGASAGVRGACNAETATALGEEYDLNPFAPIVTEMSPLCGEFLGPGVEAMVVRAVPATCGGYAGWAVFRHEADGSWQLVWKYRNGQTDLVAVGNDLEETNRILGPNDARCTGETATKARIWHWNGQSFEAGPWSVHLLGTHPSFVAEFGPRSALLCSIGDVPGPKPGASCETNKLKRRRQYKVRAELKPSGRVKICKKYGAASCGSFACGCTEDVPRISPSEQVVVGRFTCLVLPHAVRCTIASGQGFQMSPKKIARLG
jgi:hypothetical protein